MVALTSTLSFRVPTETKKNLEKLAEISNRRKSDIMLEWIDEKLALEIWQIEETKKAILLADAGDFATPEEMLKMRDKWQV